VRQKAQKKSRALIQKKVLFLGSILLIVYLLIIFNIKNISSINQIDTRNQNNLQKSSLTNNFALQDQVTPASGILLPLMWADFGKRMLADGVIDEAKFRNLFPSDLSEEENQILTGSNNKEITLNLENSRFLLDLFWAFGLANQNKILEQGEISNPKYGGDLSRFASTGGWTLAKDDTMNHYSHHQYLQLTENQQSLVEKVAKNIYRPCCDNSTYFPDCNHGMAMLGLLELMAANNVGEDEMYQVALRVNAYWFPQAYLKLAIYFQEQGESWSQIDPKLILSKKYSSASGYQKL